jgi:hypothetical protein
MNFSLKSQNCHISVDNPTPRQNQDTRINIEIPFNDDFLKRQIGQSFDFLSGTESNSGFKFTRIVSCKDTGLFQVGPYVFTLNNKKYESDSIFIKVIPSLELKEGVYISYRFVDNKNIVIIEQIYKINVQNRSGYMYSSTSSIDMNLADINMDYRLSKMYAELLESSMGPLGIDKIKKLSKSMDNEKIIKDIMAFQYSIKTYVITNYNEKAIKLTKEHFKNLPPNYILPDIIIK